MEVFVRFFPLWAIVCAALAYVFPGPFVMMKSAIVPLLSVVMLGMGMTLKWKDLSEIIKSPLVVFLGVGIQFSIMPLAAYYISSIMGLSPDLLAGMVLVGASAGGTASNVICYLAGGNVALSITMTLVSTLCAVIFTPALTLFYAGQLVPVPFMNMFMSIVKIVLIPVVLGTTVNTIFEKKIERISFLLPVVSTAGIILLIAIIFALNKGTLFEAGPLVLAAVVMHNGCGLLFGYFIPRLMHCDVRTSRTIAIEVAMQNSGLSVALAVKHFAPLAAVPGALFSIWHNVSGSILAGIWRKSALKNLDDGQ